MAICTICGAVIHDEEMDVHLCNEQDIPQKGYVIRKGKLPSEREHIQ
jgi:hypothetical protein